MDTIICPSAKTFRGVSQNAGNVPSNCGFVQEQFSLNILGKFWGEKWCSSSSSGDAHGDSRGLLMDLHGFWWIFPEILMDWMEPLEFPASALHLARIAVPGALLIQPGHCTFKSTAYPSFSRSHLGYSPVPGTSPGWLCRVSCFHRFPKKNHASGGQQHFATWKTTTFSRFTHLEMSNFLCLKLPEGIFSYIFQSKGGSEDCHSPVGLTMMVRIWWSPWPIFQFMDCPIVSIWW